MTQKTPNSYTIPQPSRPQMDPGYGLGSVSDYEMMTWKWVEEQMTKSRNYWIGTTRPDGRPHVAPVWGAWVDGFLYFGTEQNSRKGKNLTLNGHMTAHLESGDEVVILEGVAENLAYHSWPDGLVDAFIEKYGIPIEQDAAEAATCYVLRHDVVFAWLEKDFLKTATRWVFDGRQR